jgi:dTDP-4-dehydrorhamnose reductase
VLRIVEARRLDAVLHLAAETDVDRCEREPGHAYRTNAIGTANVVRACRRVGATLVYISTGGVFDGEKEAPYTEDDAPRPLSVYAKSKLEGERIVQDHLDRAFVVRAGWMIGGVEKDKKFVAKIIQQLTDGQRQILAVNDKIGSPTFTDDLAAGLLRLVETGRFGLYHMVNQGWGSRYDIARHVVVCWGDPAVEVVPVGSDRFPLPAPRGRSEAMENRRLAEMQCDGWMRPWQTALAEYVAAFRGARR